MGVPGFYRWAVRRVPYLRAKSCGLPYEFDNLYLGTWRENHGSSLGPPSCLIENPKWGNGEIHWGTCFFDGSEVLGLQWSCAQLRQWLESSRTRRVPLSLDRGWLGWCHVEEKHGVLEFLKQWMNQSMYLTCAFPFVRLNWQSYCPSSVPRLWNLESIGSVFGC